MIASFRSTFEEVSNSQLILIVVDASASKNIIRERESNEINAENLVKIIEKTKRKKNFKAHSATKVFQALRIFVNKEISELILGLINSAKILNKDRRAL